MLGVTKFSTTWILLILRFSSMHILLLNDRQDTYMKEGQYFVC